MIWACFLDVVPNKQEQLLACRLSLVNMPLLACTWQPRLMRLMCWKRVTPRAPASSNTRSVASTMQVLEASGSPSAMGFGDQLARSGRGNPQQDDSPVTLQGLGMDSGVESGISNSGQHAAVSFADGLATAASQSAPQHEAAFPATDKLAAHGSAVCPSAPCPVPQLMRMMQWQPPHLPHAARA
jgi:hypothetical protein